MANDTEPQGMHVRKNTSAQKNQRIDQRIKQNIEEYRHKSPEEISKRITQLEKEWDIERALDLSMSAMAISGIVSSLIISPYSIVLPIILLLFFIQHAFQGWCPPLPLLRKFKVRTRSEIDQEKYALKALRGDFIKLDPTTTSIQEVFDAVKKI
jgi:hypothetical protein